MKDGGTYSGKYCDKCPVSISIDENLAFSILINGIG